MKLSPESKIVMSAHHVINISPTMTSSSTFNMSKIFIFFVKLTSCISDSCDRDGRSSFSPQLCVALLACSEDQLISSNNKSFQAIINYQSSKYFDNYVSALTINHEQLTLCCTICFFVMNLLSTYCQILPTGPQHIVKYCQQILNILSNIVKYC